MLNCKQVTQLCSEEQERPLSLGERLNVSLHNMVCRGCSNYRQQMNFLRQATRKLRADSGDAPPEENHPADPARR